MTIKHSRMSLFVMLIFLFALSLSAGATQINYTELEHLFKEPVTVSATGKPQRVSQSPVSMDIITHDDIRRSGAIDIPQILRRLAGIDVSRHYKGQSDVNIRGANQPLSNRMLVLVNNRQVYMDNFGMTLWHALPIHLYEIKQIEVVKGPNSALFGFNAASGVINIVTFNSQWDNISNVTLRGGTQSHASAAVVHTVKPTETMAVRLSVKGETSDGFSRASMMPQPTENDAIEQSAFNIDGVFNVNNISDLRFEIGESQQETDSTLPFHTPALLDTSTRHYKLDYSLKHHGLWQLQLYRNEADLEIHTLRFFSPGNNPPSKNALNVFQLSHLFSPAMEHTVRFGLEHRKNTIQGRDIAPEGGSFTMDVSRLSSMWHWQLSESWHMTQSYSADYWNTKRTGSFSLVEPVLSLNVNDYDRSESEYSYNFGLVYEYSPLTQYRFSAAKGLHVPSLMELARINSQPTLGTESYGNPTLETESNTTVEFGFRRKLSRHSMMLESSIYRQQIENVIAGTAYGFTSFSGIPIGGLGGSLSDFTFENVGDTYITGGELSLQNDRSQPFQWRINYSMVAHDDRENANPSHYVDFEETVPKHRVNVLLGYDWKQWEYNLDAHYVSSLKNYQATVGDPVVTRRQTQVDDYWILNASVGYNLNDRVRLSLDGFNLVDPHQERFSYTITGGSSVGGSNKIDSAVLFSISVDLD